MKQSPQAFPNRIRLAALLIVAAFFVLLFALTAERMPNVVGESRADALRDLRAVGLSVIEKSIGDAVVGESPPAGSLVLTGSRVSIIEEQTR
ncbi:MAG TPA: PASTA domain-containing protein [Candidatus Limnocylindria bacterium]|jgi:beta-lactam-binding protein with PASTA domain